MTSIISRPIDSYQWRSGSRFTIDPGVVGARLEEIAQNNDGQITTESVANEATDTKSPLYELFEHDLEVAAYEYHRAQARAIINNLVIVTVIPTANRNESAVQMPIVTIDIETEDEADEEATTVVARAFPSVIANGQRYYTPLQVVLHDGTLRDQYIQGIYDELKSLARKASDFKVFSNVIKAISDLPGMN